MPHFELSQLLALGAIVAAFLAFAIGLLSVQIYMLLPSERDAKPIRREVTPARRGGAVNTDFVQAGRRRR